MFGDIKIKKGKFHHHKNHFFGVMQILITYNILISNKISAGEKNYKQLIGYMDNDYETKPITITLPKNKCICKKL